MFRQWQQWLGQRFRLGSRRPTRRPGRAFLPFRLEQLEDRTLLSTFVVVNINDSGPGSLRDAITQANLDTSATSVIDFNIQQIVSPPATVNTITLRSALPTITHPVQLDGTSQPGYAGIPLVELDGSAVQTAASGLTIAAGASTVKGLAIHGFRAHGIVLENLGQDVIAADFLGTDASGRTSVPNSGFDIDIEGVSGNTIGGKTSGAGNVISGGGLGIFINGGSGDVIQGNLIGTDLSGEHALNARGSGIELINGASGVLIGGTTTSARNIISGNGGDGIDLAAPLSVGSGPAVGTLIEGNYIGVDATGLNALPNNQGVVIEGGSTGNVVGGGGGGTGQGRPGTAAAGNVISGNHGDGVLITDSSSGNVVQGNLIGPTAQGNQALPNGNFGVELTGAMDNTVGGSTTGTGNQISGNNAGGIGVDTQFIFGFHTFTIQQSMNNVIEGNWIGLNQTGEGLLSNGNIGISLMGAVGTQVGGTTARTRNVIAGEVLIEADNFGNSATQNVIEGNFVGTNPEGTVGFEAGSIQLFSGANDNLIGGTASGAGNLLSSLIGDQVDINVGCSGNTVQGNKIGTDVTGTQSLESGILGNGININGGTDNLIGGTVAGAGNLISGNGLSGVVIQSSGGGGGTANVVEGNKIGTDVTGTLALPNVENGVVLINVADDNTIGGTVSGAGNLISGNGSAGIFVGLGNLVATGTVIEGNKIGTDVKGITAVPNFGHGVQIEGAADTLLGGTVPGAGNLISGNGQDGVLLFLTVGSGTLVEGNRIGTNAAGTAALGNGGDGVGVFQSATATIGGTQAGRGQPYLR